MKKKWKAKKNCIICDGKGYFTNPLDFTYRCDCYKETEGYEKMKKEYGKSIKLNINELVTLRDCVSEDILVREEQIKTGFTVENIDRPIINERKELKEKLNKAITKAEA